MPPGTPGFVGGRLTEAREARGLTAIALADLLGVSRAAVSQYESGQATPRPEIMQKMMQVLNLPPHFFSRPVSERKSPTVFYRSLSAATKGARTRAGRRLQWLWEEIVPYLLEFVELPEVNFPETDMPDNPNAISVGQIETAALELRRFWGIGDGPISNVVWLLENNGAIVTREELGAETLDSFSAWLFDGRPYVFLNADKDSAARSRFDASHELGHLVLHRHVDSARLRNPSDYRTMEEQANKFAAAFLLPAESFGHDIYQPTLDALRTLKPKWIVSIGAMLMRVERLGFISSDEARLLWIAYGRRGWRRREPLDAELPVEKPRLKLEAFELLLGQAVQANDDMLASLPFSPTDIEELAVLPRGYFSPKPPPVRLKKHSPAHPTKPSRGAEIITFPSDRN